MKIIKYINRKEEIKFYHRPQNKINYKIKY